jgi:hypothetical protein
MFQLRPSVGAGLLALLFWASCPVRASVLCATVMDLARLPLAAASLNATSLRTGKAYAAVADRTGIACFSNVPEGLYSVDASLAGFLHVKYYPVRVAASSPVNLSFYLPFSEIEEGGVGQEATISGTLLDERGSPVKSAEVCAIGDNAFARSCTVTNDLGEYALVLNVGVYRAEVRTREGRVFRSNIDVSSPGIYRDRVSVDGRGEVR